MKLIKLKKGAAVSAEDYKKISDPAYLYQALIYFMEREKWTKAAIIGVLCYVMNEGRPLGFYTYEGCYLAAGTDPDGRDPHEKNYKPVFNNDKWRQWLSPDTCKKLSRFGHNTIGLSCVGILSESDVWANGLNLPKTQMLCTDIIDAADAAGLDCHDPELLCTRAIRFIYSASWDQDYRDPRKFSGSAQEYAERTLCSVGMCGWTYGKVPAGYEHYYSVDSVNAATKVYNEYKNDAKTETVRSAYQIMTDVEWVERMKVCAREPSDYKNYFPWNLLMYSKGRRSSDCHNLQKSLFNGRDVYDKTEGSFAWPLTATGDCTEYGLLMQCSDVQWNNFKTLRLGEPRCLYMSGHFGAWLGDEWEEPGQGIVNCVESTPRWEDGIQFSYIDENGGRHWAKGQAKCGTWEAHGLASKWVLYTYSDTRQAIEEGKKAVAEEVAGQHLGTVDLAVAIIRNQFGTGYQNRLNNLLKQGYTEAEVRAAQDLVNKVVPEANRQKSEAEKALVIIAAAYDVICNKYGDGAARIKALDDEFGEELRILIHDKVEELLSA